MKSLLKKIRSHFGPLLKSKDLYIRRRAEVAMELCEARLHLEVAKSKAKFYGLEIP